MDKETAQLILSNVENNERFFCVNGEIFSSLDELQKSLKTMDENSFFYHVNNDRNDFANWIENIFGDKVFAEKLNLIKDKKEFLKKIKARITYIKKYC